MATAKQYWSTLKNAQETLCERFGMNLTQAPIATRALADADAAILAVLVKALTDKGVITDADLMEAWRGARDDNEWDPRT
jgi:hypothetical protein